MQQVSKSAARSELILREEKKMFDRENNIFGAAI
jgi:hypothetical protein